MTAALKHGATFTIAEGAGKLAILAEERRGDAAHGPSQKSPQQALKLGREQLRRGVAGRVRHT